MNLIKGFLYLTLSSLLILNLGCSSSGDGTPAATTDINIAGTWFIEETSKVGNCPEPTPEQSFSLEVEQEGTSSIITIIDPQWNETYTGTLNDRTLTWSGSYEQDNPPGIVTLSPVTATIAADCNSLDGEANWSFTDGVVSCSGTTTFIGTREPAIGCGSSTSGDTGVTVTHALLNGTWKSNCVIIDAATSVEIDAVFNNGDGTGTVRTYNDNLCLPGNLVSTVPETITYILGSDVIVDGSVAGITTATQIDITDATPGSPTYGETDYDIVAIKDSTTLYTGDISGVNDGSTPALRPTQLTDFVFVTKQ